jgi:thymidylate kinase
MTTVALVGVDGAGKSTICRRLVDELPVPATRLYMGVNLESSHAMLPTTRAALAIKRRRGQRADMTAQFERAGGLTRNIRSLARLTLWVAEEWYRAGLAWYHERRGRLVVFDRHFYCDYYATDVAPTARRPLASRIHGAILRRWYPRPDLTVVLDAPADVLFARKPEGDRATVERRRGEYLGLEGHVPQFAVIDADRPVGPIVADLVSLVMSFVNASPADAQLRSGGIAR